jgi:hypothetical protein
MMKMALMRTATGKEDPEVLLLQRVSSEPQKLQPNKCFTEFKKQTHLKINSS